MSESVRRAVRATIKTPDQVVGQRRVDREVGRPGLEDAQHCDDGLGRALQEQRDALPLVDLEVHVEQHLHRAVGEVDVRDLQHRRAGLI